MNKFIAVSGIAMPEIKSDKGYWWGRINAIYEACRRDVDIGLKAIDEAYWELNQKGMTISDPGSLVKTVRAIVAKKYSGKAVRLSAK